MPFRDMYSHHPKFHVAVDCVIFGYEGNELKLLLYPRRFEPSLHSWSLMGGFVQENESYDMAVRRVMQLTVGLSDIYLEEIQGFSGPDRDPGGRVISMAYFALIRIEDQNKELLDKTGGQWHSLTELPELIFDHSEMVQSALAKLQQKAGNDLIGADLLPEIFTLTQLNSLYNAIFQKEFDPGNFRKKVTSLKLLEQLTIKEKDSSKRGAYYFKFKKDINHNGYDRIVKF